MAAGVSPRPVQKMEKPLRVRRRALALAVAAPLVGLPLFAAGPAFADSVAPGATLQTYMAILKPVPLNGENSASGTIVVWLTGNVAIIREQVSGLAWSALPYPHVQAIHGGSMGACPNSSADTDGDGVINTTEAQAVSGPAQTTLSVGRGGTKPASRADITVAPRGSSFGYDRTLTLDAATVSSLRQGSGVVVVGGLDPSTAPQAASTSMSELVPTLPLAATAPALCGTLVAAQMAAVPLGAPATGGGSTAGTQDTGLIALGGASIVAAAGMLAYRRRSRVAGSCGSAAASS